MIAIINTAERDAEGRTLYRLQINDRLINEFWHKRLDGLGACLRLAAIAADDAHHQQLDHLMQEIQQMGPR
jgi:hypothetical protein